MADEKEALAGSLVESTFLKGEVIMREGEEGEAFYILAKGRIAFSKGRFLFCISRPGLGTIRLFCARGLAPMQPSGLFLNTTAKRSALWTAASRRKGVFSGSGAY